MSFVSFLGHSQFSENFDLGIPATWTVFDNGVGLAQSWQTTTVPVNVFGGVGASAEVNRENILQGNTSEDWLVTPMQDIPANFQLKFFTRKGAIGDRGAIYQIRISTNVATGQNANQVANYTILKTYTELEIAAIFNVYEEKTISLTGYTGNRFIAFVRVYTQPTATIGGDKWLVDNVKVVEKCSAPTILEALSITSSGASLKFLNNTTSTTYDYEYGESGHVFGTGTLISNSNLNSQPITGLQPSTSYEFYVRVLCSTGEYSDWSGPFNFNTKPRGTICADPFIINNLPYQVTNIKTEDYFTETYPAQTTSCGATPAGTNYLAGNSVFYSFTPTFSGLISITMTPTATSFTNSSIFVYNNCPVGGACIAGLANSNANVRTFNMTVTQGVQYTIVVSSSIATPTVTFNLLIQQENCIPKPTALAVTGTPTLTTADLTWVGTYTTGEVAIQPLGSLVPTGSGDPVAGNTYTAGITGTPLLPGTQYQYWVRGECTPGGGIFTAWAGPFPFNTQICLPVDTCNHIFKLSSTTATGGWSGARMDVRQNGIVIATLGTGYTTGLTFPDITVSLCKNVPFDVLWTVNGTQPQRVKLAVINSFGQTIYTKAAGLGAAGDILYSNIVNCDTPRCDIAPTNLTCAVTTTTATLTWLAPSTTVWDVYRVLAGSTPPNPGTVPSFDSVIENPYTVTGLIPDTAYDFYVRVHCTGQIPSAWSLVSTCTTIATCPKPTAVTVAIPTITTTSAVLNWTNASPTDNSWEILLVASPTYTLPTTLPTLNPVLGAGDFLIPVNGLNLTTLDLATTLPTATILTPATIYFYYIRTICPGNDKSTWSGPIAFNTVRCAIADQCNYKFLLTNTTGNSWNGGRMQVRQNGIVVTTIGATGINSATGVTVALCNNVPFDLYWSVPGTVPENIGVSIQNPFLDVLYTKLPTVGTPLTVLYNSVANCSPSPCAKPTGMTAINITATSADLSWTDNSTPAGSVYDLYVVPTGQPGPINDPVTAPTISGISFTAGVYTITTLNGTIPLTPSTSYTYYVRANCGGGLFSTWTVLTPTTFITKPLNDECLTAAPVTVNSGQICQAGNTASGNTLGATASLPILVPPLTGTGCGQTNRDVWYSFVATAVSQTITISNIVPTPTTATVNINYSVFSGTCSALTKLYCSTANSSNASGLTIGSTYYIRVYNANNTAGQSATFDLCITSPPANDECLNAVNVPVNPRNTPTITYDCVQQVAASTLGASNSGLTITGAGCGTSDDDVWYSFVATNDIHVININDVVPFPATATVTLNHTVFSGVCGTLVKLYCSTNQLSVAVGLTVGTTYYIRVYTSGSTAGQSATFNLCVNTPPLPATNDECATAINVPVNTLPECTLTTEGNIIGATGSTQPIGTQPTTAPCFGNANDDVWFTFVANSGTDIVSLLNVSGTTQNLNHAIYSGDCGALVRINCSADNSLSTVNKNLVLGNTYYIRVWSNEATSQVVTFDVCVKPVSSCQNATPFCGSSVANPYIFPNTTGLPDNSQVACLGSIPNPTFYTLHVDSTGLLAFNMQQYDNFAPDGTPIGATHDVDFVAWGPFTTTQSCNLISFTDCPTCPFSNVPNNGFYPFGNIIDCSYSGSFEETFTIPNAIAGEFYIVLITNFSNQPGYIRLVQTNFGEPSSGTTVCCNVALGPDVTVCANSTTLNALTGVTDLTNVPSTFQWFFNGSTTPIAGATASTYEATESGTYTVKGACGVNPVQDEIVVLLSPPITATTPPDYVKCDVEGTDTTVDGLSTFDLTTVTPQVLGTLNPLLYTVSYHLSFADANVTPAIGAINTVTPFTNTSPNLQTLYVRVQSNALTTCFAIVEVKLIVKGQGDASFNYDISPAEYCILPGAANPTVVITGTPTGGTTGNTGIFTYTATPATAFLDLNPTTGEINLATSNPGVYVISYTISGTSLCTDVTSSVTVTITVPLISTFSYLQPAYCSDGVNPSPILDGASGVFSALPLGLIVDPVTGVVDLTSPAGSYTVYNQVPASGPCGVSISEAQITITTKPITDFSYDALAYCKDATNPIITYVVGGVAGIFTTTPSTGLDINASTGTINLATSTAGTYVIINTVLAANGCNDVASAPITITVTAPTIATFNYGTGIYCKDGGNANPTFVGTNAVAGTFTSTPTGLLINASTGVVDLGNSSAGTYQVTNTILAIGGCAGDIQIASITITAPITGTISYNDPFCLSSSTLQNVVNTAPTGGVYSSTPAGLSLDTTTGEINPSSSSAEDYTVKYTIPAANGCGQFVASDMVTIIPQSTIMFKYGCLANDYLLTATKGDGTPFEPLTTFVWTGPNFEPTAESQTIKLLATGSYDVTVTTPDGCSATSTYVSTDISCSIQKGISPNTDGKNDCFELTTLNVSKLEIFNRYGTKVYAKNGYTNQWCGQSDKGEDLPDGTYYYVIQKNTEKSVTGWIYINRENK